MERKNEGRSGYYRSLSRNMLLAVLIVSLTPMFLVSGFILYHFHQSYEEKVNAHLTTLVRKHKQNIDAFLTEKLGEIRFLAQNFTLEEFEDQSFLENQLAVLQGTFGPMFVDLGVIDAEGVQRAYAGPFRLTKALYSTADWFERVMREEFYVSDVFLGLRLLPHFIIAVKENSNARPWILRATIDFVAFNDLVEKIRIGETGFAFILNRLGAFQTKPFLDVSLETGPYLKLLAQQQSNGREVQIVKTRDEAGEQAIYVSVFLKNGDWWLVYRQKAADAFADFNNALKVSLVFILLSVLLIVTTGVMVSRRMVNRIYRSDQEKRMMNEQVVETGKLASVGELAAGIAHEINNPVAIMVEEAGWIGDLLTEEEFKDSENLQEFKRALEQIRTQGRRCKEITHKLLSFARKTDPRIQEVQINELMEELVALSKQRAKFSNIEILTAFQEDLPLLRVSQSELQQVFLNLINNAIDAMEKRGGSLEIGTKQSDHTIVVEISDTGPGIPQANLGRIFNPFFTTKPVGKGTGLGLAICYGIVKKLGGEIEVRSELDVGTTFKVILPFAPVKTAETDTAPGEKPTGNAPLGPSD